PNALIAEIVDYDEHLTGMRREAMFFGVQGLLVKIAMGLSTFAATQLLEIGGFSAERSAGVSWVGPLGALFVALGMLVFAGYPESTVRAVQRTAAGPKGSRSARACPAARRRAEGRAGSHHAAGVLQNLYGPVDAVLAGDDGDQPGGVFHAGQDVLFRRQAVGQARGGRV